VSALVASELLKIRTTRSFWGYVAAIALRHGLALTELKSTDGAGLEEMFLELTADTQREGVAA